MKKLMLSVAVAVVALTGVIRADSAKATPMAGCCGGGACCVVEAACCAGR